MKHLNFLAIIISAVVAYLLSAVWYLVLFTKPYVEGLSKTTEELAKGPSALEASLMQVVGNLVMACVLSWLLAKTKNQTLMKGMRFGALMWVGFVAAVLGPMYAFEANSFQFFCINAGSQLVTLLVMGAILGKWKA